MENKTVVVVFSGGQDSTTCLLSALKQYKTVHCITFDYNQRHRQEISVAKRLCHKLNVKHHHIMAVPQLKQLTKNALTCHELDIESNADIPNTFVPGRNILFLTLASIYAYQVGAEILITGVCETDFSNYPDCRSNFIQAHAHALSEGLGYPITIATPLMQLTKAQVWAMADQLGHLKLIQEETLTCYEGIVGSGCGECPACRLRQQGLEQYQANLQKTYESMPKYLR